MSNDYGIESIKVLSDIEHIQKRPGMYIGLADNPLHLFNEALDNALDESQSGNSDLTEVEIRTTEDGEIKYSIRDYGRGIPIGIIELSNGTEMDSLEAIYMKANSGAKFDSETYRIRSGLHGVGGVCICALSKYMRVVTVRNRKSVELITRYGKKESLKHNLDKLAPSGVLLEFIPDENIFDDKVIPIESIIDRCKIAKAMGHEIRLYYDGNEIELKVNSVLDLFPVESDNVYCQDIIKYRDDSTGEYAIVGFKYTSDTKCKAISFTNLLPNRYGGTHVNQLESALIEAFSELSEGRTINWDDHLLGARLIVAVFIDNAAFSSQTKERLTVSKAQLQNLKKGIKSEFSSWLNSHEELATRLLNRFEEYRISQNKFHDQKEIMNKVKLATTDNKGGVRRKSVVPGLIECTSNKRDDTDLYIVEGNSAAGSVARPRDKATQAVLPLRGKIQNVAYMDPKEALKHQTVLSIVNAIGCGILDSADPSKSRYERIIIAADEDPDGAHVSALVLTTLVNLLPNVVKAGMVYLLNAPFYKYTTKDKKVHYTNNFDEVDSWSFEHHEFLRFKGLGSMSDEDFKVTCLDKNNRNLSRVIYPDDIDEFNRLAGTSEGRSELLKRYGVIKDTSDIEDNIEEDDYRQGN